MVEGRKHIGAWVAKEGGPTRSGVKGKNFNMLEEEHLWRSMLFVL